MSPLGIAVSQYSPRWQLALGMEYDNYDLQVTIANGEIEYEVEQCPVPHRICIFPRLDKWMHGSLRITPYLRSRGRLE